MEKTGLVKYDAMMSAIVACSQIDEIKDLRDKAYALQLYAQQAKNTEAEKRAAEIRIRAERKTGQLLLNGDMARGGGDIAKPKEHRSYDTTGAKTLDDIGISKDQSSRWQKLAAMSDGKFDSYFTDTDKPSTAGVINLLPPKPKKPRKRTKAARPNTASCGIGQAWQRPEETEDESAHRSELSQACYVLASAEITKEQLIERVPPQWRKRLADSIDRLHGWSQ